MIWRTRPFREKKRAERMRNRGWHYWFAWKPVEIDNDRVVWLSLIERFQDAWISVDGNFRCVTRYRLRGQPRCELCGNPTTPWHGIQVCTDMNCLRMNSTPLTVRTDPAREEAKPEATAEADEKRTRKEKEGGWS